MKKNKLILIMLCMFSASISAANPGSIVTKQMGFAGRIESYEKLEAYGKSLLRQDATNQNIIAKAVTEFKSFLECKRLVDKCWQQNHKPMPRNEKIWKGLVVLLSFPFFGSLEIFTLFLYDYYHAIPLAPPPAPPFLRIMEAPPSMLSPAPLQ
jgi:hypothetical protein